MNINVSFYSYILHFRRRMAARVILARMRHVIPHTNLTMTSCFYTYAHVEIC